MENAEADIRAALAWELSHRLTGDEWRGGPPVAGFGSPVVAYKGPMTLWLPHPKAGERTVVIKGGKPIVEISPGIYEPHILELRDNVIQSASARGAGLLQVDVAFMEYTIAVLGMNYRFDDQDLTLLLGGDTWQEPMMAHLLGGVDAVRMLSRLSRQLVEDDDDGSAALSLAATPATVPAEPATAPLIPHEPNRDESSASVRSRGRWWTRLLPRRSR